MTAISSSNTTLDPTKSGYQLASSSTFICTYVWMYVYINIYIYIEVLVGASQTWGTPKSLVSLSKTINMSHVFLNMFEAPPFSEPRIFPEKCVHDFMATQHDSTQNPHSKWYHTGFLYVFLVCRYTLTLSRLIKLDGETSKSISHHNKVK